MMTNLKRGARTRTDFLPVGSALVGVTLVVTSVVFFYIESDLSGLVTITNGLAVLVISVWFAANPPKKGIRRYRFLRREITRFISLAQLLNKQVVAGTDHEFVARTKAKMHQAVDRMVAEADKTS